MFVHVIVFYSSKLARKWTLPNLLQARLPWEEARAAFVKRFSGFDQTGRKLDAYNDLYQGRQSVAAFAETFSDAAVGVGHTLNDEKIVRDFVRKLNKNLFEEVTLRRQTLPAKEMNCFDRILGLSLAAEDVFKRRSRQAGWAADKRERSVAAESRDRERNGSAFTEFFWYEGS